MTTATGAAHLHVEVVVVDPETLTRSTGKLQRLVDRRDPR